MSTTDQVALGAIVGSLSVLAVFVESPAPMVRLFEWIRGNFTRGRHHQRAILIARPFDERHPRPTPAQIRARIGRETKLVKVGTKYIAIDVDFRGFNETLARALAEMGTA